MTDKTDKQVYTIPADEPSLHGDASDALTATPDALRYPLKDTSHLATKFDDVAGVDDTKAGPAADDTPEIIRNGNETTVQNHDYAINYFAPNSENDDDSELSEKERIKKRIRELGDQASQARERAKQLEEERKKYINLQNLSWPEGTIRLSGGFTARPTADGGKLTTSKDLSKAVDPNNTKDRRKLDEMLQHAVGLTHKNLAQEDPDTPIHLVMETRRPLLSIRRETKNPVKGSKKVFPTIESSLMHGAMKPNSQLAQTAQEIANFRYGKDSNGNSKVRFHASYDEARQALENEQEKLKQKFKQDYGEDPEALNSQADECDRKREDLEQLLPSEREQESDPGEPEKDKKENGMLLRRGERKPVVASNTPGMR